MSHKLLWVSLQKMMWIGWIVNIYQTRFSSSHRVAVITTNDPRKLNILLNWRKAGIDFWSGINTIGDPMTVMVPPHLHKDFYASLQRNSIPFEEMSSNLGM